MINIKTAIQNNRPLIGAYVVGFVITYSLLRHASEHQKLTAQLNMSTHCIYTLFGILDSEGIIQKKKTN